MKFSHKELVRALDILKVTSGNKIMQVADFVKIAIDREMQSVYLMTTDYIASTCIGLNNVKIDDSDQVNTFLINVSLLYHILKESNCDVVDIQYDKETDKVVVKANGIYNFVPFSDVESFPVIDFNCERKIKFDAEKLNKIWDCSSLAISRDVTKIEYQGVYFDGNWVSTDGRRVAVSKNGSNEVENLKSIIPPIFGQIIKNFEGEVSIGISNDNNDIILSCEKLGILCSVRTIAAQFPNYRGILGMREKFLSIIVNKNNLLDIVRRLLILTDKLFKTVDFVFYLDKKILSLLVTSQNGDKGEESIPILGFSIENNDEPIGNIFTSRYQIDYLKDGLEKVRSNEGLIDLDIQKSKIMYLEDGEFLYLMSNVQEK